MIKFFTIFILIFGSNFSLIFSMNYQTQSSSVSSSSSEDFPSPKDKQKVIDQTGTEFSQEMNSLQEDLKIFAKDAFTSEGASIDEMLPKYTDENFIKFLLEDKRVEGEKEVNENKLLLREKITKYALFKRTGIYGKNLTGIEIVTTMAQLREFYYKFETLKCNKNIEKLEKNRKRMAELGKSLTDLLTSAKSPKLIERKNKLQKKLNEIDIKILKAKNDLKKTARLKKKREGIEKELAEITQSENENLQKRENIKAEIKKLAEENKRK